MSDVKKEYDKEKLSNLLLRAKGHRTMTKFAEDSGISVAHVSRMINKKLESAPSPETLKSLVPMESNGVTYEDLLIACGYLNPRAIERADFIYPLSASDSGASDEMISIEVMTPKSKQGYSVAGNKSLMYERTRMESMFTSILMLSLNNSSFGWRIEKEHTSLPSSYRFDLMVSLYDSLVEKWYFDFHITSQFLRRDNEGNDHRMRQSRFRSSAFQIWGRLAAIDIQEMAKYSIVSEDIDFYNALVSRPPINLNMNISVILIDLDSFRIIKEGYLTYSNNSHFEDMEQLRIAPPEEY